ncbi:MAG: PilZ domain-containing protein [Spirochaetota bacterium]|nr:PilZ domain-containing protein [Spirochaetota bacterium]
MNEVDKRKCIRKNCCITVKIKSARGEEEIIDGIKNISSGGIFVSTTKPLEAQSKVKLIFDILDEQKTINCDGTIMWNYHADPLRDGMDMPGMGILLEVSKEDATNLAKHVEECN